MFALGIVNALLDVRRFGRGMVVDAAMSGGAASLMMSEYGRQAAGTWVMERASNIVDGGAPFYSTYETADGKWIAIAPIEAKFYKLLLKLTGADPADFMHRESQVYTDTQIQVETRMVQDP